MSSFASKRNSLRRPVPRRQTRPIFRTASWPSNGRVTRFVPLKQAGIDCELRQQGGAETVVDHLHQCWKARRFEALGETPVRKTADRKRVVTQAVPVLQQQQVLAPQALGLNARLLGEQVLAR